MSKLLILFTPRCGSTLLASDLINNGIGVPFELFYRTDFVFASADLPILKTDRPWSEWKDVFDQYTVGGIFAVKMYYHAVLSVDQYFGDGGPPGAGMLKLFGSDCMVVIMYREDAIAQAVSLHIAERTGKWSGEPLTSEDEAKILMDNGDQLWYGLHWRFLEICQEHFFMRQYVKEAGFENVQTLSFEHYLSDRPNLIRSIGRQLGKDISSPFLSRRTKYTSDLSKPLVKRLHDAYLRAEGYLPWARKRKIPQAFYPRPAA